jgi:hypothetical protein
VISLQTFILPSPIQRTLLRVATGALIGSLIGPVILSIILAFVTNDLWRIGFAGMLGAGTGGVLGAMVAFAIGSPRAALNGALFGLLLAGPIAVPCAVAVANGHIPTQADEGLAEHHLSWQNVFVTQTLLLVAVFACIGGTLGEHGKRLMKWQARQVMLLPQEARRRLQRTHPWAAFAATMCSGAVSLGLLYAASDFTISVIYILPIACLALLGAWVTRLAQLEASLIFPTTEQSEPLS